MRFDRHDLPLGRPARRSCASEGAISFTVVDAHPYLSLQLDVGRKRLERRAIVLVEQVDARLGVPGSLLRRDADDLVRPGPRAAEGDGRMQHQTRRPEPLPERLGDHDGRGEKLGIGVGEPAPVLEHDPVDRAETRIDDAGRDVHDALGQLDRQLDHPAVRLVREAVALEDVIDMRLPRVGIDGLAALAEGRDRDRRLTSAPPVVLLGEVLALQIGDRDDGGERRDGDRDADEAEQHPELVDAQLVPRLARDADDGGGPDHQVPGSAR